MLRHSLFCKRRINHPLGLLSGFLSLSKILSTALSRNACLAGYQDRGRPGVAMGVYEALGNISVNSHWLITTNLVMGALLLLWILRYFRLSATARESEWRNTATVENLAEGFYRTSVDGKQLYANAALVKINGYDSAEEMLANVNDIASEWYVDPGRREEFRAVLAEHGSVSNLYRKSTATRPASPSGFLRTRASCATRATAKSSFTKGQFARSQLRWNAKTGKQLEKLAHNLSGGLYQLQKVSCWPFLLHLCKSRFRAPSRQAIQTLPVGCRPMWTECIPTTRHNI
ncbi:MAG: PAS domain-containing protein [Nitratireductor sp.]